MTPTSVGMRCPECAGNRTRIHRLPRHDPTAAFQNFVAHDPRTWSVTHWLMAINTLVFLFEVATGVTLLGNNVSGTVYEHGVLFGPYISGYGSHQYWRLITSGFLHESVIHIGLNMWVLWSVGRLLEPAIGRLYFAAIYFAALLAGSFGALLLTPDTPTLGASGAIFGVMAALIVVAHARHLPLWSTGLIPTLLINFAFTLAVPHISIGGHVGGCIAGFITGRMVVVWGERRAKRSWVLLGCLAIAVLAVVGSIAVAGGTGLLPSGNQI
jgi:membrane associated rhomboid family serine protease